VILDGATANVRQEAAITVGRALLCDAMPATRPCGHCRNCRRIVWPGEGSDAFHPDFAILVRDLKTATSAAATKSFARAATVSPFEARGQVFVVANAETLSPEAADALLKLLEEPPVSAPRHFLLLAPSRLDLLPTLRSRSLAVYLGAAERLDPAVVARLGGVFGAAVDRFGGQGAAIDLLLAAATLLSEGGFEDPRAGRPWALASAAVASAAASRPVWRRRLLALAEALLGAGDLRLRAIPADRILEGLVVRHLALPEPAPPLELR
jgi:hypothetical protein